MKKFLITVLSVIAFLSVIIGIFSLAFITEARYLRDQISLIDPPTEIINGQVRTTETTIIYYYNEGDQSKRVTFTTCGGDKLNFSDDETNIILKYFSYQKVGCP